jgi:hypothetical protein
MTDDAAVIDEPIDEVSADTEMGGASPSRSLGPVIALGLAAAVAIAAIVVALVGGDDVSPTAVRVNTGEVSQKTFDAQLADLAPSLRDQQSQAGVSVTATDASVPSSSAARLASLWVSSLLLRDQVDRLGITISDADLKSFAEENREVLSPYGPSLRDFLIELNVMQNALIETAGEDEAATILTRTARRANIHVDARYGFWDAARGEVCPPTGCAANADSGADASTGSGSASSGG